MKALVKKQHITGIACVEMPQLDEVNNVLIRVKLAALCRTDINVAKGTVPAAEEVILGHEFYGEVVQVTPAVRHIHVGDKVTIDPTRFGQEQNLMCGVDVDGAFAEYIKAPENIVFTLPESLPPTWCVFVEPVAASLAVLNAPLDPLKRGCIYGNNRIAALTHRIMRLKGFDNIVLHDEATPLPGNTYDYIIETIARTEDLTRMVAAIKVGGTIVLKSRQYDPVEISIGDLVKKDITLCGAHYGDFREAINMLSSGQLDISDLVGESFALEQFEAAFEASGKSESQKCYLTV